MSSEFEKKIEKLFLSSEKILSLDQMNSLIKESFINKNLLNEENEDFNAADFLKYAPKAPLAEKLIGLKDNNVDSESLNQFRVLLNDIVGSGDTIQKKFSLLKNFLTSAPKPSAYSISQILNYITFLRVLNSLMYDYSGATAGNLHEAFIAAMTGGKINPANNTIDDVITSKGAASLKLLSHDQAVKGSISLLLTALQQKKNIIYYVGFKHETGGKNTQAGALNYYKTFINLNNIANTTNIYKILSIKPEELPKNDNEKLKALQDRYDLLKKEKQLPSSQFTLFKTALKEKGELISLNVSKEQIINTIQLYSNYLSGEIFNIYKNLYFLSQNVNKYYYSKDKQVTSYANNASANANEIKNILEKSIGK